MSEYDQQSGGTRPRRLLARALVVAGATVAGVAAAWLAGSAAWADSVELPESPPDRSATANGSAEPIRPRHSDPGTFSLRDLEAVELIPASEGQPETDARTEPVADPAHLLAPVCKPVDDALRQAESTTRPLRRVAEGALPGAGLPPGALPAPIDGGLRDLGGALWESVDGSWPEDGSHQAIPADERPAMQALGTVPPAVPERPAAEPTSARPATTSAAFHPGAPADFPAPARVVVLPGVPAGPGSTGPGGTADGHGYTTLGVGSNPAPSSGERSAGVLILPGAWALSGLPGPQPGTTPD